MWNDQKSFDRYGSDTNHFVDSVKIEKHNVSTIDAEHLQIFHN